MGETSAMKDSDGTAQLTCENRGAEEVITAAVKALADFKNPFDISKAAIRPNTTDAGTTSNTNGDRGYANLTIDATDANMIIVKTCYDDNTSGSLTACTEAAGKDEVSNNIAVAE